MDRVRARGQRWQQRYGTDWCVPRQKCPIQLIQQEKEDPVLTDSPDKLLERGIADYTYLPAASGGVLGKGKFSTVYKVLSADNQAVRRKVGCPTPCPLTHVVGPQAYRFTPPPPLDIISAPAGTDAARPATTASMPDRRRWLGTHRGPFLSYRCVLSPEDV
jgi:hypothetical protein